MTRSSPWLTILALLWPALAWSQPLATNMPPPEAWGSYGPRGEYAPGGIPPGYRTYGPWPTAPNSLNPYQGPATPYFAPGPPPSTRRYARPTPQDWGAPPTPQSELAPGARTTTPQPWRPTTPESWSYYGSDSAPPRESTQPAPPPEEQDHPLAETVAERGDEGLNADEDADEEESPLAGDGEIRVQDGHGAGDIREVEQDGAIRRKQRKFW